jgi:hypothetical protein
MDVPADKLPSKRRWKETAEQTETAEQETVGGASLSSLASVECTFVLRADTARAFLKVAGTRRGRLVTRTC